MIVDCVSDLHGYYPELEGGDLLIIAGDLGQPIGYFMDWIRKQKYKNKIFIAGNHDTLLYEYKKHKVEATYSETTYLCDSGTEFVYIEQIPKLSGNPFNPSATCIKKLKIWGSPWVKSFEGMNPNCKAFTLDTEEELAQKWALIPDDVDILITHSPQFGILDEVFNSKTRKYENVGSKSLSKRTYEIASQKKRLHVCGHVHERHGIMNISDPRFDICNWKVVNASYVSAYYEPINKPIRVIL